MARLSADGAVLSVTVTFTCERLYREYAVSFTAAAAATGSAVGACTGRQQSVRVDLSPVTDVARLTDLSVIGELASSVGPFTYSPTRYALLAGAVRVR